jgi:hypothetical protein
MTRTRKLDMTRSDPSTSTAIDPTRFSVVDDTADPDFYVRFMEEGHRIPDILTGRMLSTATRQHTHAELLGDGQHVGVDSAHQQ